MTHSLPVVLDCNIFGLQRYGGISNYWGRLINYLRFEPDVMVELVLPNKIKYQDFDRCWISDLNFRREILHPLLTRYLRSNLKKQAKVFHTPYYRLPGKLVEKYVVSLHDFTYERMESGLRKFVHNKQKFQSIRMADEIICFSESTKRDVLEFCPWVDNLKLHVVPHGVDHEIFYPEPSSAKDSGNSQMVLFVGQRTGYKRFDIAIDAIRGCPSLSLGIVGPPLNNSEKIFLQEQLGYRWLEFGPIPTPKLRMLYSSSYALIFPSDYEGFGLPILEAMACGCPVVAANLSSFPDVGGDVALYARGQCGEAYVDQLNSLKLDGTYRQLIIDNGIQWASKFQWNNALKKTKEIYFT